MSHELKEIELLPVHCFVFFIVSQATNEDLDRTIRKRDIYTPTIHS